MLFDWLIDPDFSLQQIRKAFGTVKRDTVLLMDWIRYLYRNQRSQQQKIEEMEKRIYELERERVL